MKKRNKIKLLLVICVILVLSNIFIAFKSGLVEKSVDKLMRRNNVSTTYPEYERRKSVFKSMPTQKTDVLFLGDSLIAGYEWNERLQNIDVANRGISGDTIIGVRGRLDSLMTLEPKIIVLMVGINDLNKSNDPNQVFNNYSNLIDDLQEKFPRSIIKLNCILNVNPDKLTGYNLNNDDINEINNMMLKKFSKSYDVIDLRTMLNDEDKNLNDKYTYDGLHLTGEAYEIWLEKLNLSQVSGG